MLHDRQLYDRIQHGFPLTERPFAQVGALLGFDECELIDLLARDMEVGRISRIGAVFAPNVIGVSTLAALAVPPNRLDDVAALVSAHPEVSHNYARDGHRYNLWFVAGARNREGLDQLLGTIALETGLQPLDLPLEREFHIDLGFALSSTRARTRNPLEKPPRQTLDASEWRLVGALESGLPLTPQPYHALAEECGTTYGHVVARLARWQANGVIRRFGAILHHRRFGYSHNAMCVWSVPDGEVDRAGEHLATLAPVSLCYRRTRRPPAWPFNLFAMVHARDAESLAEALQLFARDLRTPDAVLRSRVCYKQCGTRYAIEAVAV